MQKNKHTKNDRRRCEGWLRIGTRFVSGAGLKQLHHQLSLFLLALLAPTTTTPTFSP